MTIQLPTDIASLVNSQVESGAFSSTDEVLRAAMQSLEREARRKRQKDQLREMLLAASEQVRHGETLDVDQAFDEVEVELFGNKFDLLSRP